MVLRRFPSGNRKYFQKIQKHTLTKSPVSYIINKLFTHRGVAQFGSVLGSGPRGRGFESRHSDQKGGRFFIKIYHPFLLRKI